MEPLMILQILGGWLLADFLGGVVHWWEDRVGDEAMPLIGRWVVAPNRLHHRDAMAFTRKSVLVRNWTALALIGLVGGACLALFGPSVVLITALVGAAVTVEVHYQAHLPNTTPPWLRSVLRPLWDIGLVQSPAAHNRHHERPDSNYCALTGWLNPVLTHVRLWERLEWALTAVGLEPNRGTL
jgi:ubiquitin-conjugating enzyme E2 variant